MVYPHGGPFATQFSHRLPISVPWSGSCSLDDERHHNVSVRSPSLCLSSVSHSGTSLLEGQGSTSLDDSHRPQVALSTVVHGSLRAVLCCSFPASSEAGPPCTAEIFDQPESHGLRAPLLCCAGLLAFIRGISSVEHMVSSCQRPNTELVYGHQWVKWM